MRIIYRTGGLPPRGLTFRDFLDRIVRYNMEKQREESVVQVHVGVPKPAEDAAGDEDGESAAHLIKKLMIDKFKQHGITDPTVAFKGLDTDHDGRISREEFTAGLLKLKMPQLDAEQTDQILELLDRDGDGSVDYTEFSREFSVVRNTPLHASVAAATLRNTGCSNMPPSLSSLPRRRRCRRLCFAAVAFAAVAALQPTPVTFTEALAALADAFNERCDTCCMGRPCVCMTAAPSLLGCWGRQAN